MLIQFLLTFIQSFDAIHNQKCNCWSSVSCTTRKLYFVICRYNAQKRTVNFYDWTSSRSLEALNRQYCILHYAAFNRYPLAFKVDIHTQWVGTSFNRNTIASSIEQKGNQHVACCKPLTLALHCIHSSLFKHTHGGWHWKGDDTLKVLSYITWSVEDLYERRLYRAGQRCTFVM